MPPDRALWAVGAAARQRIEEVETVAAAVTAVEPAERAVRGAERAVGDAQSASEEARDTLAGAHTQFQSAVEAWQGAVSSWIADVGITRARKDSVRSTHRLRSAPLSTDRPRAPD